MTQLIDDEAKGIFDLVDFFPCHASAAIHHEDDVLGQGVLTVLFDLWTRQQHEVAFVFIFGPMGQEARSNRLATCIEEQAEIGGGEALRLMDFDRRGPFARPSHIEWKGGRVNGFKLL